MREVASLQIEIRQNTRDAVHDAADLLTGWIRDASVRRLMVAAGNTPLPLYEAMAKRGSLAAELDLYVLDEYVGVPESDPRTCTNLLRRAVAEPWNVPLDRFSGLSSDEHGALPAVLRQERLIDEADGLDAIILGLGKNGHLGFNEPGSAEQSGARIVDLDPSSVAANREWFGGEHAPHRGATVGLRTILAARRVLLLAFGAAKADAAHAMIRGPRDSSCPASFLQGRPGVHVFLDEPAAAGLV